MVLWLRGYYGSDLFAMKIDGEILEESKRFAYGFHWFGKETYNRVWKFLWKSLEKKEVWIAYIQVIKDMNDGVSVVWGQKVGWQKIFLKL